MIRDNILKIKERIFAICAGINRNPDEITIIAVSKGRTIEEIKEVVESGISDIGENRVQETLVKYNGLRDTVKWHMLGHLQTNKVREAVRIFDLIQSVESLRLAQEIDKQAAKINKIQDILIEIKTSKEATKFGIKPDDTIKVISEIAKFKNINLKGLMTIAPIVDNPQETRLYFRKLKELLEEINAQRITQDAIRILSMGMTNDFAVAIEEGANMIRLGRAIFETTDYPDSITLTCPNRDPDSDKFKGLSRDTD